MNPRVDAGDMVVTMSREDWRLLKTALETLLDRPAPEWVDKRIRDISSGEVVAAFVKGLDV